MAIFQWDESLSLGIEKIDSQHRELIRRIDDLAAAVLKRRGQKEIVSMIRFMEDYGKKHFSDEEEFMAKIDFPHLEKQRKQHEKFRIITKKLAEEVKSQKNTENLANSVQRYLIDWLILHIKSEDMKIGEFLRKVGR